MDFAKLISDFAERAGDTFAAPDRASSAVESPPPPLGDDGFLTV